MSTRQTLIQVRKLVEAGWLQFYNHTMDNGHDRYCLLGAINKVTHDNETTAYVEAKRALAAVIPSREPVSMDRAFWVITKYNDHPGRTQAEVLAVIDLAIARAA